MGRTSKLDELQPENWQERKVNMPPKMKKDVVNYDNVITTSVNTVFDKMKEFRDSELSNINRQRSHDKMELHNIHAQLEKLKHESMHNQMVCPSCHKHELKLDRDKLIAGCVGNECNKKYLLIDMDTEYGCHDCHFPLDLSAKMCPICNSKLVDKMKKGSLNNRIKFSGNNGKE